MSFRGPNLSSWRAWLKTDPQRPPNWRAEGMKPQSMGTTIAALEEMGIVERKPHPTDGRQVNVALTAKGTAMRNRTADARLAWLAEAIGQLDEQERETLFKAGEIIMRLQQKNNNRRKNNAAHKTRYHYRPDCD